MISAVCWVRAVGNINQVLFPHKPHKMELMRDLVYMENEMWTKKKSTNACVAEEDEQKATLAACQHMLVEGGPPTKMLVHNENTECALCDVMPVV